MWLPLFIPIGQLSGFYTVQLANHSGSWKDNKRWCPSEGNKKKKKEREKGDEKNRIWLVDRRGGEEGEGMERRREEKRKAGSWFISSFELE